MKNYKQFSENARKNSKSFDENISLNKYGNFYLNENYNYW